eukprot:CAMPEP_0194296718 /NCGR_PEP_ID=MMETSP0169-20130528/56941_1 /TAXON_ID=218684 /ORGANISM="Corethron pennatum, Strain L29A3" /LENGTH=571 /DNA_ID=CAMNT_0039046281 /DNA_START=137 /DNA_END=1852 /DNA_ORIENTATION=+
MDPEKYQRIVAKAKEASARNTIERNEENRPNNTTKAPNPDGVGTSTAAAGAKRGNSCFEDKDFFDAKIKKKDEKKVAAEADKDERKPAAVPDSNSDRQPAAAASASTPPTAAAARGNNDAVYQRHQQTYERKEAAEAARRKAAKSPSMEQDEKKPAPDGDKKLSVLERNFEPSERTFDSRATVVSNPLNTDPSRRSMATLRPPSVRVYIADAELVVESSDPPGDPLDNALTMVDRLSVTYQRLGPGTSPLLLRDALVAALACCDDATGGLPLVPPPVGCVRLSDALVLLSTVTCMYQELESEERIQQVPVIRTALTGALARCEQEMLQPDKKQFCAVSQKKLLIVLIAVCLGVAVTLGVILSKNGSNSTNLRNNGSNNTNLQNNGSNDTDEVQDTDSVGNKVSTPVPSAEPKPALTMAPMCAPNLDQTAHSSDLTYTLGRNTCVFDFTDLATSDEVICTQDITAPDDAFVSGELLNGDCQDQSFAPWFLGRRTTKRETKKVVSKIQFTETPIPPEGEFSLTKFCLQTVVGKGSSASGGVGSYFENTPIVVKFMPDGAYEANVYCGDIFDAQ